MRFLEIFKWWWESNIDWIRIHDPWVIPIIALCLPLSMVIRALCTAISLYIEHKGK